jgi:serine palmitoyltransferase
MFDLIGREFDGSLYGSFQYTGEKMRAINLGSYNYLGFAENAGKCIDDTIEAVHKYGISTAGRRMETGSSEHIAPEHDFLSSSATANFVPISGSMDLHRKLELRMADFLGKEDAIIFNMGYATNSTSISALIGKVR